jgi:hypothetical protein
MRVAGPGGLPVECIWWRGVEAVGQIPSMNSSFEMVYSIETSAWNDEIRLQLNVEDLRMANAAP